MFLIGLTGGISCGKSTVSKIFKEEFNTPVIDADLIAKQVVEPKRKGWYRIKKYFGEDVFNSDGSINRDKLGEIIFSDSNKRKILNKCLHDLIIIEIFKQIFYNFITGSRYVIIDVPLLFETKFALNLLSYKLVVYCDQEQQLSRLLKRNPNLSIEQAKQRIQSQMSNNERLKLADHSIDNTKDIEYTRQQVIYLDSLFKKSKKYISIRIGVTFLLIAISTGLYFATKLVLNYFNLI